MILKELMSYAAVATDKSNSEPLGRASQGVLARELSDHP
jgi:hypothetical protein